MTTPSKCSLDKPYGDIVCRNGILWGLTYSERAPPDSRQAMDDCPLCAARAIEAQRGTE